MSDYEVLWVATKETPRDYYDRQMYANEQGAHVYIEHHFNAKEYDREGIGDNPTFCLVGSNASETSKAIGRTYSDLVSAKFGTEDQGVIQCAYKGRGDYNLRFTGMPAILLEPLFVSDEQLATIAMSDVGQQKLAQCLVDTIKEHFPSGAKVAFSIGHKYKVSQPYDRGAPVAGGNGLGEADIAEDVMILAAEMLASDEPVEVLPPASKKTYEFDKPIMIRSEGSKTIVTELDQWQKDSTTTS